VVKGGGGSLFELWPVSRSSLVQGWYRTEAPQLGIL